MRIPLLLSICIFTIQVENLSGQYAYLSSSNISSDYNTNVDFTEKIDLPKFSKSSLSKRIKKDKNLGVALMAASMSMLYPAIKTPNNQQLKKYGLLGGSAMTLAYSTLYLTTGNNSYENATWTHDENLLSKNGYTSQQIKQYKNKAIYFKSGGFVLDKKMHPHEVLPAVLSTNNLASIEYSKFKKKRKASKILKALGVATYFAASFIHNNRWKNGLYIGSYLPILGSVHYSNNSTYHVSNAVWIYNNGLLK